MLEKVRQTTKAPMGGVLEDSKVTQERGYGEWEVGGRGIEQSRGE